VESAFGSGHGSGIRSGGKGSALCSCSGKAGDESGSRSGPKGRGGSDSRAKDEFKAHCARHDKAIDKAIVDVISSDHPSDGQLVAMARQYFLKYDQMHGQR
jgi:hypothetical protein